MNISLTIDNRLYDGRFSDDLKEIRIYDYDTDTHIATWTRADSAGSWADTAEYIRPEFLEKLEPHVVHRSFLRAESYRESSLYTYLKRLRRGDNEPRKR